jgi:hypothetical protein
VQTKEARETEGRTWNGRRKVHEKEGEIQGLVNKIKPYIHLIFWSFCFTHCLFVELFNI